MSEGCVVVSHSLVVGVFDLERKKMDERGREGGKEGGREGGREGGTCMGVSRPGKDLGYLDDINPAVWEVPFYGFFIH